MTYGWVPVAAKKPNVRMIKVKIVTLFRRQHTGRLQARLCFGQVQLDTGKVGWITHWKPRSLQEVRHSYVQQRLLEKTGVTS